MNNNSSMDDMKDQATKEDNLVPIRLEFEADGYKLRDTFTWNLNGMIIIIITIIIAKDLYIL